VYRVEPLGRLSVVENGMKRTVVAVICGLSGLAVLLTTILWYSQKAISDRDAARFWETHTREVLLVVEQTLSALQDAESSERNYVITARTQYREAYEAGRANVAVSTTRLAKLTEDNAIQQSRIGTLQKLVTAKLAELAETVALISAGDRDAALAIAVSDQGKELTDKVRKVLGAIGEEENRLLAIRHSAEEIAETRDRAWTFSIGGFGALTLLAATIGSVLSLRSMARVQSLQADTAAAQRLRLVVGRAPASIAMFDMQMRYLEVNQGYLDDYDLSNTWREQDVIGRSHYDLFPEIPQRWREIHRRVLAGETCSADDDSFIRADGRTDWVRWQMVPWHQADGSIGGALLFSEVLTARKQAAARQDFLFEFAALLQSAPRHVLEAATARLGAYLKVCRASYGEVDAAQESVCVGHEYLDGTVPSVAGTHRLAEFGQAFAAELIAGRTVIVSDVTEDDRTRGADAAYRMIGTRAVLVVPLVVDGHLRATLHVCYRDRHDWSADEVSLVEEVAARTWSAVEQVRAKEALERTVDEFRTLADGIPTLCWMAEPDGHIYWYNQRWYEYTGTTFSDMQGWGWQSVHDPDVLPAVLERWQTSISEGLPFEMTFPLRGADGIFRPFMTRIAPMCDENGQVRRWLGVNSDVTDAAAREAALQRSTDALRDSEARLQVIFDTAPVGIFIGEAPTGKLVACNRQAEAIFRHPLLYPPDVQDHQECMSFHPDGRRVENQEFPLARALAGEEHPEAQVLYQCGDGSRRWLRLIAAPVRSGVAITGAVGVALDVDRETRAIEALSEVRNDLEQRVTEEIRAREATQSRLVQAEKLTALGQLAGGIAHDFNNVLQAVSGGISLIVRHRDDPVMVKRFGGMVADAAQRGASVTRRLLAFARRGELRAKPLNISQWIAGLHEILAHSLGAAITIRLDVENGLSPVLADQGQLETVVINLATNARDAMPDGGTVVISAGSEVVLAGTDTVGLEPGRYVRLTVADDGTGMDPATLARVMEPFFTTKGQGKGTGLGLPMARGFAEQSGGALTVTSELDVGTTVTLWLPVAADESGRSVPEDETALISAPNRSRVMLVDDEPLVREVLAAQLADSGFDVVQADHGEAALALLDEGESVDLLVSDLSMPGMNGVALIHAAQLRRPRLPAILLTGYAGDASGLAVSGALNGSFSLLRKPVSGAQLTDRVATLLEDVAVN
jgi:PAS domain S-box-containing protein